MKEKQLEEKGIPISIEELERWVKKALIVYTEAINTNNYDPLHSVFSEPIVERISNLDNRNSYTMGRFDDNQKVIVSREEVEPLFLTEKNLFRVRVILYTFDRKEEDEVLWLRETWDVRLPKKVVTTSCPACGAPRGDSATFCRYCRKTFPHDNTFLVEKQVAV